MKPITNIKRTEDYTENTFCLYALPNYTTMERLADKVTAEDGAVLRYGDRVLVADRAHFGFIAAVYEFIDDIMYFRNYYSECRLSLIAMSNETFLDGGHAIAWALAQR